MLTTAERHRLTLPGLVMAVASAMVGLQQRSGRDAQRDDGEHEDGQDASSPPRASTDAAARCAPRPRRCAAPAARTPRRARCRAPRAPRRARNSPSGRSVAGDQAAVRRGTRPRSRPARAARGWRRSRRPSRTPAAGTPRAGPHGRCAGRPPPAVLEPADEEEQQRRDDAVGDVGEERGLQPGGRCRWPGRARRSPCGPPRSRRPAA